MNFYRSLSKIMKTNHVANPAAVVPWYQQDNQIGPFEEWYSRSIYPYWFKFVKGPWERYCYEQQVAGLRGYGLMLDDCHNDKEPVIERALEMLPHDMMVQRYRRMMRAADMNFKKTHLPIEEQNYDPMIPYLAPFVEEAKFQMQEEQELLNYHPWDRRLYSGGVTGFGESSQFSTFSSW